MNWALPFQGAFGVFDFEIPIPIVKILPGAVLIIPIAAFNSSSSSSSSSSSAATSFVELRRNPIGSDPFGGDCASLLGLLELPAPNRHGFKIGLPVPLVHRLKSVVAARRAEID
ncbi:hypothetical protein PanWU01x14_028220 [Parasponia andersonii]|uniref:Uncharacterized protein n=1 Tax=Parasponia andersonii TaxID=3476 RepID=A0A2P5DV82_PARAD|nr:hypothetical protein PanWU01x14_028220 [Parasponia andersonii]